MQTYANALLIAIPFFLILMGIEMWWDHYRGNKTYRAFDTISSLASGMTNTIKTSLGLIFVLVSYPWLEQHLAVVKMPENWIVYLVGFIAIDFAGYWAHRLSHKVNFFWNNHVIHHSSEEFNLPCALRQSISQIVGISALFLLPAALLGVPHKVILIIAPIQLFMQFWYHTRYIGKLGWLEYIIITPSQHRVHHAINPQYLDKNLGQIFCIWDRLFGTFQEELDDVPPVYGVTIPAQTWNPVLINFQHIYRLGVDAWRAKSWWDKARIWWMPTGWRPADVAAKYPQESIKDIYNFSKYDTPAGPAFKFWAYFQLTATVFLLLLMLWQYGEIGSENLLIYGILLFSGIYGFTTLMDGTRYAGWIEGGRSAVGLLWIIFTGSWFGIEDVLPGIDWVVAGYFIISLISAYYFSKEENRVRKLMREKAIVRLG